MKPRLLPTTGILVLPKDASLEGLDERAESHSLNKSLQRLAIGPLHRVLEPRLAFLNLMVIGCAGPPFSSSPPIWPLMGGDTQQRRLA